MKKLIVAVIAIMLMACAMSGMAQRIDHRAFTITPSLAYTFMLNGDVRDDCGNPFGIVLDFEWQASPIGIEAGYLWSKKDGAKHTYMPIFASYYDFVNDQAYWKVAPGMVVAKHDGDKTTKFGFEIGYGAYLNSDFNVELDYVYYNKLDENKFHGIQASIGYTF